GTGTGGVLPRAATVGADTNAGRGFSTPAGTATSVTRRAAGAVAAAGCPIGSDASGVRRMTDIAALVFNAAVDVGFTGLIATAERMAALTDGGGTAAAAGAVPFARFSTEN